MKRATTYRVLAKDQLRNNDTWATGLSNNDIIIGPSGAGKTRGYVIPNILQCNESMIIADTKGSIREQVEPVLRKNGYRVLHVDFSDCHASNCGYNPFDYIRFDRRKRKYKEQDILTIASCMIPLENSREPIWELSARTYLETMVGYVLECLPEKEHNMTSVLKLFNEMPTGRYDRLMKELCEMEPNSFTAVRYQMTKSLRQAEKMYESIRAFIAVRLDVFTFDGARTILEHPYRILFSDIGMEKTAVFVTVSDTDRSMDYLANLFYTQAIQALCNSADKNTDHCLKMPVRLILDDFAANVVIPDFNKIIAVIRSREISVSIILQSLTQLDSLYGHPKATTILQDCDNLLYLGGQDVETAEYIGKKANKTASTILNMSLDSAWLFTRGEKPQQVKKYDLKDHQRYQELPEYLKYIS